MRAFFYVLLCMPYVCLGSSLSNIYVGGGLGWSFLSAKRTLMWDRDVYYDVLFAENQLQRASGFDDTLFVGWWTGCGHWVYGAQLDVGYACSKITFQKPTPYDLKNVFVSSLSQGMHGELSGLLGYRLQSWAWIFKAGYALSQMTHVYEDLEKGSMEDRRVKSTPSSALVLGFLAEKNVTPKIAVRLGYTYALYTPIEEKFRNGWNNTTVVQQAQTLRNQSIMLSIVWYPWRKESCFGTS